MKTHDILTVTQDHAFHLPGLCPVLSCSDGAAIVGVSARIRAEKGHIWQYMEIHGCILAYKVACAIGIH